MEMQILSLVLILICCLVGIRLIAARSLAVARLRIPSPRHHVHGRQRRLPPLPAAAGSLAQPGAPPPGFFFSPPSGPARPGALPPAAALAGGRGVAGVPLPGAHR